MVVAPEFALLLHFETIFVLAKKEKINTLDRRNGKKIYSPLSPGFAQFSAILLQKKSLCENPT
jgi:hypothetical protein